MAVGLKLQVTRTCHLEPQTVRATDRSHQNVFAIGALQNRAHRSCVQGQRPYAVRAVAGLASDFRERKVRNEDVLKETCGSIAVEDEVGDIVSHGTYSPDGPNRSVLMLKGSKPSSTSRPEMISTKAGGPQT